MLSWVVYNSVMNFWEVRKRLSPFCLFCWVGKQERMKSTRKERNRNGRSKKSCNDL